MPISGSRYFNDPNLAAAASNLAGLFAPPSGSDAAGWAAAGAKKAEAARLAALFDYQKSPDFNQQQFDRMGEAAGAWTPNQSFYAVDQGDATARRGQDVTAQTSLTNNTADNARALATNAADNARAFKGTQLTELGNLFDPVAQDATRPAIPADIASQFGVGHGLVAEHGKDSPLTESQLHAAILGEMPRNMQEAAAFGNTPIEPVVTPAGPKNVLRTDAIGQTPYDKPTGATETQNYKAPDGTVGSAYFDPTAKQWLDTTTGQAIPPNSVTFSAGLTGGTTETGLGGKFTERDSVIQLAGENMKPGIAILNKAFAGDQALSTGALFTKGVFGDNPAIRDIAQSLGIVNPVDQEILGGIDSVLNYLYLQTGAARTESEDTRAFAALAPLSSDTPANRQLKRDMFNQKAMSIINQAKDPELRRTLTEAIQGIFKAPDTGGASTVPTGNTVAAPNTPADAAAPKDIVAPGTTPSPTKGGTPDGTIIQNDAGQKMIRRNGTWEPYSG